MGNLVANGIRNVWTNAIIFCGHFTEDAQTYTRKEVENDMPARQQLAAVSSRRC